MGSLNEFEIPKANEDSAEQLMRRTARAAVENEKKLRSPLRVGPQGRRLIKKTRTEFRIPIPIPAMDRGQRLQK